MELRWTTDGIEELSRHSAIWPWVSSDETPADWKPEGAGWLAVIENGRTVGAFLFEGGRFHVAFLPVTETRMPWLAVKAGRQAVEMAPRPLRAEVPADNERACRYVRLLGFAQTGVRRKCFPRDGKMIDCKLFEFGG